MLMKHQKRQNFPKNFLQKFSFQLPIQLPQKFLTELFRKKRPHKTVTRLEHRSVGKEKIFKQKFFVLCLFFCLCVKCVWCVYAIVLVSF